MEHYDSQLAWRVWQRVLRKNDCAMPELPAYGGTTQLRHGQPWEENRIPRRCGRCCAAAGRPQPRSGKYRR